MSGRDERRLIIELAQALEDLKRAALGSKVEAEGLATHVVVRGDTGQLAALVITVDKLLWRMVQRGAPVLSMSFGDVVQVMVNDGSGVMITYHPSDLDPDVEASVRTVNPTLELDAEFIFGMDDAGTELRQALLDRAMAGMEDNLVGEALAHGSGYLEGIAVDVERYSVSVEARGSAIAVSGAKFPRSAFPYSAASWFRVGHQGPESFAAEMLRLSPDDETISLSLGDERMDDRWRLIVKPDDIERWRVLLEHFSIRDASR